MLQAAGSRLRGVVAAALQDSVARDVDGLVKQLLDSATLLWFEASWEAFDHQEANCTAQLYRWCVETQRTEKRFALITVQLEWLNLTPAMLAAREGVASASRPDLRICVGSVGRTIECKRLTPTGAFAHDYVHEGMARFVTGDYGQGEPVGYMVGYVQTGTFVGVSNRVNSHVRSHPDMGVSEQLTSVKAARIAEWYQSDHVRTRGPVQLQHLLVDLNAVDG